MKQLKYLVIHCTATPQGREVTREDIEQWHLQERSWSRVGYSDMIHLDGSLGNLIPFNQDNKVDSWEISNGARGYNGVSRHVVYVGGASDKKPRWAKHYPLKDTRTDAQKRALHIYVFYMILRHPNIKVIGHNEISNKGCPSFDVGSWLRSIGVPEQNIGV